MAKIYKLRRTSTLVLRQRKAALLRQLSVPADLLRASYVERFTTCGKPNCVCVRGQRHGPFYYLTANLAPGHITKSQLNGPRLSVILDLEPIRPGEDEAAAALRLLGRMRRL